MSNKNLVDSAEYMGYWYAIEYDEDPQDPTTEMPGHVMIFSRRHSIGENHKYSSPRRFLETLVSEVHPDITDAEVNDSRDRQLIEKISEGAIILPVAMLDHSGIKLWVGSGPAACDPQGWDSGQVGWIYTTAEEIRAMYRNEDGEECIDFLEERAKELLEQQIDLLSSYIGGECYGVRVYESEDDIEDADYSLEQSFGYFDLKEAIREAQHLIEYLVACDHMKADEAASAAYREQIDYAAAD